jgi:hypothetical protein
MKNQEKENTKGFDILCFTEYNKRLSLLNEGGVMSGTLLKIDRIIENKRIITFRQYNRIPRDLTYLDIPYQKWFEISKKTDYIRKNLIEKKKKRVVKKPKPKPRERIQ